MNDAISPAVAVSDYLRDQSRYPGSSSSIFYNPDGSMAGAFVTVFVPDRHQLRGILTYLGVPKAVINPATGFDD